MVHTLEEAALDEDPALKYYALLTVIEDSACVLDSHKYSDPRSHTVNKMYVFKSRAVKM